MKHIGWQVTILSVALQGSLVSVYAQPRTTPDASLSLQAAAKRELAHLQVRPQPPPRPSDVPIPLPSRRHACSWVKGVSIGAGAGAAVGATAGALIGNPDDFGGRAFPAMAFGIVGAGIGAAIGFMYCH